LKLVRKPSSLIDRLLPAQVKRGDPEEYERARIMAVVGLVSVPLYAIFFYEALVKYGFVVSACFIAVGGLAGLSGPVLLRRTGSVVLLGNYLAAACFSAIAVYSWQRGGFVPTILSWDLTIVAFSLIQRNQRFLLGWALAIFAEISILWVLRGMGIPATKIIMGNGYAGLVGSLLAITLVSFYVERGRTRADVERARLRERLMHEQRLDSLGRMAGGVAHDFNNLLSVVKLHAALALEEVAEDDTTRDDLETILDAARRGSSLTSQLLAFGRHDAVNPEVLDAGAVVADMGTLLRGMAKETAKLKMSVGDDLPLVRVDRAQLEQVVMNLVLNACDASSSAGMVKLELRSETLSEPEISQGLEAAAGRYLCVEVRDEGAGIDDDVMPFLFEPFFTSKPRGKGTGLGLATVYGIVKRAHGLIRVRSDPGRGTTFELLFPAAPAAETNAGVKVERSTGASHTATVLIAEDEASCRTAVQRILRSHGHTALTAEDGDSALAVSEHHKGDIHVLLTDIQMPGLDGVALATAIRAQRPAIRVVYMSGAFDRDEVRAEVDAQRASFLQKPIDAERLLQTL
jgi:signal transduction histidine kinase/CheY-like chemotaxis protein